MSFLFGFSACFTGSRVKNSGKILPLESGESFSNGILLIILGSAGGNP